MSESVILPDFASLDEETQERLQALLHAAGITKIGNDGRAVADPELLKRLTSSVSNALDEAAAALTRMKSEDKSTDDGSGASVIPEMNGGGGEEGESLLSLACSAGYYELAQVLLAMRTNVEDRGSKGDCTPLMEAASAGHADIVKLLICHGADVNAQSSTGNTPLMYACASGHEEVVRVLLDAGADVELHNENGHNPLMEAASAGHVGIARQLVDNGAQVNAQSTEFKVGLESPLTLACYKGHLQMVRYLLQAGHSASAGRQEELHTALMEASMDGHVEVARLLLDAGARVNLPTDSFESPLTLAACGGHVDLAKLLLERGANLEEPNDEGYTPLMEAAREGHEDVCKLLLEFHAEVNAQTEETGETALTLACCGGFQEVAALLLDHGADIELGANTPLMEAAQEGHTDLVRFLIKRGADVSAATASGDTPLTYAAENGHTDVCGVLLDAGANLDHGADGGRTALMKAARAGHGCTLTLLMNKGADPNQATSANDHTALSLACTGGHLTTVELLLRHGADPQRKLKDGTTCIMEAAKGGHTTVVQLLLDWPALHPAPSGPVLPLQTPDAAPSPNGTTISTSVSNLLPLQAAAAAVAVSGQNLPSNHASLAPGIFGLHQSTEPSGNAPSSTASGPLLPTVTSEKGSLPSCKHEQLEEEEEIEADGEIEDEEQDPLSLAQSALLQQVSAELCPRDYQKLQDLLQTQFHETAANLYIATTSPSKTAANAVPKSKKAELEQAVKELEQLKKTQQLYEQIQKALEAKAAAAVMAVTTEKVKTPRAKNASQKSKNEPSDDVDSSSSSSPPPVPPVQFQLPQLDSAQVQYLQQQFSMALQQSNSGFQFPAAPQMTTGQLVFPNLPVVNSNALPMTFSVSPKTGQQSQQQQQDNASNGLFVPIQLPPEITASLSVLSASQQSRQLPQCQQGTAFPSPAAQTSGNAFNLPVASSGFSFTPHHLLPPPPVPAGDTQSQGDQQQQNTTMESNPAPLNFPTACYGPMLAAAAAANNNNTKGTQTSSLGSTAAAYQPQPGAFQPPEYQITKSAQNASTAAVRWHEQPAHVKEALQQQQQAKNSQTRNANATGNVDLNTQTDSNHDTALTLACAGGHEELVLLLLQRGADIEHRDKKGFTPLILAATAGHAGVVESLLEHGASVEAQSERTKDTALSLACSGGRRDVVEILLKRAANKEHRNVSDYTPLSLAASGGYTEIIQLLLQYGAEINSRTGSKLGISPLMLAAMNGHAQAVKMLLERGADINAQIETNRNTALTLACFQGRHEVVKLLLAYRANVEHRAKTGLTPLMEAASGGYVEVGKVLIHCGADVNSAPVPASRDTALTIAADKGHAKFAELLLQHGAQVDCKTKKGCTALWLAANGGHLDVVQGLVKHSAQVDEPDNRRVTPLMAAFRKGHVKVVKFLVRHVAQFPSDQECHRYLATVTDKDLLVRQAMETIMSAKDRQAQEANKAAAVLLQELEEEQQLAETRRQAKLRQKEKKKLKRKAKKTEPEKTDKGATVVDDDDDEIEEDEKENAQPTKKEISAMDSKKEFSPTAFQNSSASRSISPSPERVPPPGSSMTVDTSRAPPLPEMPSPTTRDEYSTMNGRHFQHFSGDESGVFKSNYYDCGDGHDQMRRRRRLRRPRIIEASPRKDQDDGAMTKTTHTKIVTRQMMAHNVNEQQGDTDGWSKATSSRGGVNSTLANASQQSVRLRGARSANNATSSATTVRRSLVIDNSATAAALANIASNTNAWRESTTVKRPSNNKILVSSQAIARVIGRGGQNINAIREASGAHIEVEKQQKGQTDRLITIRGTTEATKQAILMINALINEPDVAVQDIVSRIKTSSRKTSADVNVQVRPATSTSTASAPSKPPTVTNSKSAKFPEISVWVPTSAKSSSKQHTSTGAQSSYSSTISNGPVASTAASNTSATRTTPSTTAPKNQSSTDYSPFSTGSEAALNVWQKRAYLLQQKKRADLISGDGGAHKNQASYKWPGQNVGSSSSSSCQNSPPTSTSAVDDLKKAPGYRPQTSSGQQNRPVPSRPMTAGPFSETKPQAEPAQKVIGKGHVSPPAGANYETSSQSSQLTPPPSRLEHAMDENSFEEQQRATAGLSSYLEHLVAKTAFSSPCYSQPSTQRNSLGFDSSNVTSVGYETDNGRRSAGASAAYFSPIALPRPASATAAVGLNDENAYGRAASPSSTASAHSLAVILQQLQQEHHEQQMRQQEATVASNTFPTPIGGERSRGGGSRGPVDFSNPAATLDASNLFTNVLDNWELPRAEKTFGLDRIDWTNELSDISADLAQLQAAQEQHLRLQQRQHQQHQQQQQQQQNKRHSTNFDYVADVNSLLSHGLSSQNQPTQNFDSELLQQAMLLAATWQQRPNATAVASVPTVSYHQQQPAQQQQQHLYQQSTHHHPQMQSGFGVPPPPFPAAVPPPGFGAPPPVSAQQNGPMVDAFHLRQPPPPNFAPGLPWPTTTAERDWKFHAHHPQQQHQGVNGQITVPPPPNAVQPNRYFLTTQAQNSNATNAGGGNFVFSQQQQQQRNWNGWNSMAM